MTRRKGTIKMNEELVKALKLIKQTCEQHPNCKYCPMFDENSYKESYTNKCYLRNCSPNAYKFKEQTVSVFEFEV